MTCNNLGTVKPMSRADVLLNEPQKILVLAGETERWHIQIDANNINSLVFILKSQQVPFFYRFTFDPLPYSEELVSDVRTLHGAGYLTNSSIKLLDKGRRWVAENHDSVKPFADAISSALERVGELNEERMFRYAYNYAVARL